MYGTFADLIKDFGTPAIALAALVAGLWQYRRTSKRDFQKPLREAQLALYREATSAAATLSTAPRDSAAWKEAHAQFLQLYFGPLAILEDFEKRSNDAENPRDLKVEQAMIVFKTFLDMHAGDTQLRNLSLALAHTCRESLGRSWGVKMSELEGRYQPIAFKEWRKIKDEQIKSGNDQSATPKK